MHRWSHQTIQIAIRRIHSKARLLAGNKGTGLPSSTAFPSSAFKQGDYLEKSGPAFKQAPEESIITVDNPSPSATNKLVQDSPDPTSYRETYVEADRAHAASSYKPSSTNTAPAHNGLAQQMKKNGQTETLGAENRGFDRSLPPDFNKARQNTGPLWSKEDIKRRT